MADLRSLPQKLFDTALGISGETLNTAAATNINNEPPLDIALKRHSARIKAEAVDSSGNVQYSALKTSGVYAEYRQLTTRLPHFDLRTLDSPERKLAFWLNLYNSLTINGIIHADIHRSVEEQPGFFRRSAYNVGGYRFSLDDIEHGILRANSGNLLIPGPQFHQQDPRLAFALDQIDPRIHFALNCGARSCPPVQYFDADQIDIQLDLAARNFLAQSVTIDPQHNTIRLSKLLRWYAEDFGAGAWIKIGLGDRRPVLRAILPYLDKQSAALIERSADRLKIRFSAYDWSLNAV